MEINRKIYLGKQIAYTYSCKKNKKKNKQTNKQQQ